MAGILLQLNLVIFRVLCPSVKVGFRSHEGDTLKGPISFY